jgi:hypothetical protein
LGDSMALIEGELRKALNKEYLFEALIAKLNVTDGDERVRMQDALAKALSKRDESRFRRYLADAVGAGAAKTVEIIIGKLFGP